MSETNAARAQIAIGAGAALHQRLRGKRAQVYCSDMKVRIPDGNIRYPDVMVDCGKPKPSDLWAAEPRVIVEVLSPSTEWFDKTQKLEEYQSIPSVAHVALLAQNRAFGRVWTRAGEGWESVDSEGLEAKLAFGAIEAELPLSEAYEGVEFEAAA